jgi:FHA domain
MAISNVFEKLGRAIFESPFGSNPLVKDAPELAEIRLAVLDAVKAKGHRAGGRNVFPYNLVRIKLLGISDDQARVLQHQFLTNYFADELKAGLLRQNYRFPEDLRVEMLTTPDLPMAKQSWLSVETDVDRSRAGQGLGDATATLVVVHGTANVHDLPISKTRTNIGRTSEVYRADGPSRRNDLAFDEDSPVNQSVSRQHAHIIYRTGEYRLFNDRIYKGPSNNGLWIVRDGASQPVHRGNRGTLLEPGDEIHLGDAILRFELRPKDA